MSIVNHEYIIDRLSTWIAEYAINNNKSKLFTNFDGTLTSVFVTYLCICATTKKIGNLSYSALIYDNVVENKAILDFVSGGNSSFEITGIAFGLPALKPIAPHFLAANFASNLNGIYVGDVDRTFGLLNRVYNKHGKYIADIQPVFNLLYSEILEISEKLNWGNANIFKENQDVVTLNEWAIYQDSISHIITSEDSPINSYKWCTFSNDQKTFVANLHQREKKTRHKAVHVPFCSLRDNVNYIR